MAEARHRRVLKVALLTIAFCLHNIAAHARYGGGAGEPNAPYLIFTAQQLRALGAEPHDWDKHFRLMTDIDLAQGQDRPFDTIGVDANHPFTGRFDGGGHTIRNLSRICAEANNVGLFGYIQGHNAQVRDLCLDDPNIDAANSVSVGSLVGALYEGTVANCCVRRGRVAGRREVGGLVGSNHGRLTNSYATCYATGEAVVGGLVGTNGRCYRGEPCAPRGVVLNCFSAGKVAGADGAGGLVGDSIVISIRASFWDTQASGQSTSAGGTGMTTVEMQTPDLLIAAGWDFFGDSDGPSDVWTIDPGTGYPMLWWQAPHSEWPKLPSFSGGSGTLQDPYLISTPQELSCIGHNPRLMDSCFRLIDNVDLEYIYHFPIGAAATPFAGIFDGGGRTIRNFGRYSLDECEIGLFGYVRGEQALIRGLTLVDPGIHVGTGESAGALAGHLSRGRLEDCHVRRCNVTGKYYIGGLVGRNDAGLITRCDTGGVVAGTYAGGLAGYNESGVITDCYSTVAVAGYAQAGGLIGLNSTGSATDCHASGSVVGTNSIGGLAGSSSGALVRCISTGGVSGEWGVGGLVGDNHGAITDCHVTADVSGSHRVGGLAGENDGQDPPCTGCPEPVLKSITRCSAIGRVEGTEMVGGLVGWSLDGLIAESYATGSVTGDDSTGGLAGQINTGRLVNCYTICVVNGGACTGGLAGSAGGNLIHCYAGGPVTGSDETGGLIGRRFGGKGTLVACFWDTQVTTQAESDGGTGITTVQMQTADTFLDVGWDFVGETANGTEDIWRIREGRDYPRLSWEPVDLP